VPEVQWFLIREEENGGYDTVKVTVGGFRIALPANVERLDFVGDYSSVGYGNSGNNRFTGSTGDDRFIDIAGGNDIFSGGLGSDTVDFRDSTEGAVINLLTKIHGGAAAGDIYASIEKFIGSDNAGDTMIGGAGRSNFSGYKGNDTLVGGDNIDILQGGGGDDWLSGLAGADTLDGGVQGNDTLTGGSGRDQFVYSVANPGDDVITDFEDGLDKLKMHGLVATSVLDFSIAGNGTTSVMLTLPSDPGFSISLNAATAIHITAADFLFF
jgi:Ca2+-binding RTX toxin-like protein